MKAYAVYRKTFFPEEANYNGGTIKDLLSIRLTKMGAKHEIKYDYYANKKAEQNYFEQCKKTDNAVYEKYENKYDDEEFITYYREGFFTKYYYEETELWF